MDKEKKVAKTQFLTEITMKNIFLQNCLNYVPVLT